MTNPIFMENSLIRTFFNLKLKHAQPAIKQKLMISRSDKVWEVTSDSGEMQATIVSVRRIKDTPSSIFQIMYFFNSRFF